MVTPFLRKLQESGTLYVFPSASKDLTRTFVSNDYDFKFSHFACLNLPDIDTDNSNSDSEEKGKKLNLNNFEYKFDKDYNDEHTNYVDKAIVEHLQNYVMNFETIILNGEGDDDGYDNDILTSVSEKVFFNWLQKVGGISFNGDEEDGSIEKRTIPYIGNIDIMNTVEFDGDSFEELYITIPSTVGASTSVKFRSGSETDNKNYLNKDYHLNGENETCISGRKDVEHPDGLSTNPLVDVDEGNNIYSGDVGYTIDFRNSSYGDGIMTMNEKSIEDFEFNAILIYYDLLRKTNKSNIKELSTNLYGILFLGKTSPLPDQEEKDRIFFIERYPKSKKTNKQECNSWAFKLDLKVDTLSDANQESKVKIQDITDITNDNPKTMYLYENVLVQLQKSIDLFYEQRMYIEKLEKRISDLEMMLFEVDTVKSLRDDINRLYDLYDGNGFVDTTALQGLIKENSDKLNAILRGDKNIKLQYDMDVIQSGKGISIDKSLNKVVINSDNTYTTELLPIYTDNTYTTELIIDTTVPSTCTGFTKLKDGDNLIVLKYIYNGDCGDIDINISEDDSKWKAGKSVKICLISYNGVDIKFKYNSSINIKTSINGPTISISTKEIDGKKMIELVCIDIDNLGNKQFIYFIK